MMNLEKKCLKCLQDIPSIEWQIKNLIDEYSFLNTEKCVSYESSIDHESCSNLEHILEDFSYKSAQNENFAYTYYMTTNEKIRNGLDKKHLISDHEKHLCHNN